MPSGEPGGQLQTSDVELSVDIHTQLPDLTKNPIKMDEPSPADAEGQSGGESPSSQGDASASSSRRSSRWSRASSRTTSHGFMRPNFNIIDPNVQRQHDEWEDLLYIEGGSIPYEPEEIFGEVTEKYLCASIWLSDALHARAVDYPRSDEELKRLAQGRSSTMRNLFNVAAVFQILAPFLHHPFCAGTSYYKREDETGWMWFVNRGAPSIKALALVDSFAFSCSRMICT